MYITMKARESRTKTAGHDPTYTNEQEFRAGKLENQKRGVG